MFACHINIINLKKISEVGREKEEYTPSCFVAARIIPAKRKARKKQKII